MTTHLYTALTASMMLISTPACDDADSEPQRPLSAALTELDEHIDELGEDIDAHHSAVLGEPDLEGVDGVESGHGRRGIAMIEELQHKVEEMHECRDGNGSEPDPEKMAELLEGAHSEMGDHGAAMSLLGSVDDAAAEEDRHREVMAEVLGELRAERDAMGARQKRIGMMCPTEDGHAGDEHDEG